MFYGQISRVIETVQRMFLQRIIDTDTGKPRFAAQPRTINQHIKYRQQHDSGEIGYKQTYCHCKSLVIEQRTGNAAHENQRDKDGYRSQ